MCIELPGITAASNRPWRESSIQTEGACMQMENAHHIETLYRVQRTFCTGVKFEFHKLFEVPSYVGEGLAIGYVGVA